VPSQKWFHSSDKKGNGAIGLNVGITEQVQLCTDHFSSTVVVLVGNCKLTEDIKSAKMKDHSSHRISFNEWFIPVLILFPKTLNEYFSFNCNRGCMP